MAETEGQRHDVAVHLRQRLEGEGAPLSFHHEWPVMLDQMRLQDRRIRASGWRFETIAETLFQPLHRGAVGMDVHQAIPADHKGAQVIDAMDMIGMRMRVDHAIDMSHRRQQHLSAEIGASIDGNRGPGAIGPDALYQGRGAHAAVPGIGRITVTPVTIEAWYAWRRSAAENGEAEPVGHGAQSPCCANCGIFENSRKKLLVVIWAISSWFTPIVSARTLAVSVT